MRKLLIAAAGSGKTTYLVREALSKTDSVLITTFTEVNEEEIRGRIIREKGHIPDNITIQTWFSFLIQHGAKPYQDYITQKEITGLLLVNSQSAPYSSEEREPNRFYLTDQGQIYSDKLSKFVFKCEEKSNGLVFSRISKIFKNIFIDEVQDLAGYDLDLIKKLFQLNISTVLVGDPRQVTYLTHHEKKNQGYKDGKIDSFIRDHCKRLQIEIDTETLSRSHRNNEAICTFASRLYPQYPSSEPCECCSSEHVSEHSGIFIIRPTDVDKYIKQYNPKVLRYSEAEVGELNFGASKGLGFERVLLFPTKTFLKYLKDGRLAKVVKGKEVPAFVIPKHYVAITRARKSVAIVCDYNERDIFIEGVQYAYPSA